VRREPADRVANPGNGPIGEPDQLKKWRRINMEAEIARTPINLLRESKLAREWAGDLGLISGAREGEVEVVGCVGIDELEG